MHHVRRDNVVGPHNEEEDGVEDGNVKAKESRVQILEVKGMSPKVTSGPDAGERQGAAPLCLRTIEICEGQHC